jgi:hypothetical protein
VPHGPPGGRGQTHARAHGLRAAAARAALRSPKSADNCRAVVTWPGNRRRVDVGDRRAASRGQRGVVVRDRPRSAVPRRRRGCVVSSTKPPAPARARARARGMPWRTTRRARPGGARGRSSKPSGGGGLMARPPNPRRDGIRAPRRPSRCPPRGRRGGGATPPPPNLARSDSCRPKKADTAHRQRACAGPRGAVAAARAVAHAPKACPESGGEQELVPDRARQSPVAAPHQGRQRGGGVRVRVRVGSCRVELVHWLSQCSSQKACPRKLVPESVSQ